MQKEKALDHLDAVTSDLLYARELIEKLEQVTDEARNALSGDDVLMSDARQDELHELVSDVAVRVYGDLQTIEDTMHEAQYQAECALDEVPSAV